MNFSNMFFGTYVIYYPVPINGETLCNIAPPTIEKTDDQNEFKPLDIW